jgi:5-methylcytosine-specific restriction protein B
MLQFNNNFDRLIAHLKTQGDAVKQRSEDTAPYKQFIQTYPLERLSQLSLDEYCVGKGGGASFCWWIERGLEQVLGRYMPGTSRGHVMYFRPDGSVYKAGALADLSDEAALRYTLRVQNAIASASPSDMLWVDDDKIVFDRAGVDSRITVGDGRKLRLLACYHPAETLPISSSSHLQHFLKILGCPEGEIPGGGKPVARMLKLRGYFLAAREQVQGVVVY